MAACDNPTRRPIVIAPYNPGWPRAFEAERTRLLQALGAVFKGSSSPHSRRGSPGGTTEPSPCLPILIEHIGSTAVPDLASKPVIDMMIGLDHLDQARFCIPNIVSLGYVYVPEFESAMPYRRFFYRDVDGVRSHHIHMVAVSHEFWARHLLFRDWLRAHPAAAREYESLKRNLAAQYRDDVAGYAEAKTEFIHAIESQARA